MGDPRKQRRKYKKPSHLWESGRIKQEIKLKKEYGLANKKEIWKATSKIRGWRREARHIFSLPDEQQEKMKKEIVRKLNRLGLLGKGAHIDDILALDLRSILDRRLQSQVYKLGLSNSIKQSRQFILHGKILVNNNVITAPSYLVKSDDNIKIIPSFSPRVSKVVTSEKKSEGPKEVAS